MDRRKFFKCIAVFVSTPIAVKVVETVTKEPEDLKLPKLAVGKHLNKVGLKRIKIGGNNPDFFSERDKKQYKTEFTNTV